jgi:hypothetical protein
MLLLFIRAVMNKVTVNYTRKRNTEAGSLYIWERLILVINLGRDLVLKQA